VTPSAGVFSYPGRLTVRVPVPVGLLIDAQRLAEERGVDVAIVLGDLAAAALPDALADAARDLLQPSATTPSALAEGVTRPSLLHAVEVIVARRPPLSRPTDASTSG
jgi:hypothetical protein